MGANVHKKLSAETERNLLAATIGAMMDRYVELKERQEDACADDMYEQILIFCADKVHQVSRSTKIPNSAYLSIVHAKRHVNIENLSFKTPEKCAEILENFRAERAQHRQNAENTVSQEQIEIKKPNFLQRMKSKLWGR